MTKILRLLPLVFAAAWAPEAGAQTAPPASASPAEPPKQCVTAKKKVDAEQRSLAAATDALVRDKKARESCSSKSMCERYDTSIAATEKRKARHETRLTRFKDDAEKACKTV